MIRFFSVPCMWLVLLFGGKRGHFGEKAVEVIQPTVLPSDNPSSQDNHTGDHTTEGRGHLPACFVFSSHTKRINLCIIVLGRRLPCPPYMRPFCRSFIFIPFSTPAHGDTLPFPLPLPCSCFVSNDECQVFWACSPEGWGLRLGSTPETQWSQQRWVILNCAVTSLFFPPPFLFPEDSWGKFAVPNGWNVFFLLFLPLQNKKRKLNAVNSVNWET